LAFSNSFSEISRQISHSLIRTNEYLKSNQHFHWTLVFFILSFLTFKKSCINLTWSFTVHAFLRLKATIKPLVRREITSALGSLICSRNRWKSNGGMSAWKPVSCSYLTKIKNSNWNEPKCWNQRVFTFELITYVLCCFLYYNKNTIIIITIIITIILLYYSVPISTNCSSCLFILDILE
jgi:hypothetical protein